MSSSHKKPSSNESQPSVKLSKYLFEKHILRKIRSIQQNKKCTGNAVKQICSGSLKRKQKNVGKLIKIQRYMNMLCNNVFKSLTTQNIRTWTYI